MNVKRSLGVILLAILFLLMTAAPVNADTDRDQDKDQDNPRTPSCIGGSGIVIDGYYDDWDSIPKTQISWGDYNGKYFHEGAMIKDGDYIYVYLETHKKYSSQIPLSYMVFSVDGHDASVFLHFVNQDGTGPDWTRNGELYDLCKGIHLGLAPFTYYPSYPRGVAAVTIDKNNNSGGDKLEFAISIRELALMMHVDASEIINGGAVSFYVPDLGPQKLELVGTPTGTYAGVFICVLAIAGIFIFRKYRRKEIIR